MGEVVYNGHKYSTESAIGKEALKWETPRDYRPEQHPYKRMLYKAKKGPDGVVRVDAGQTLPRQYFGSDADYEAALKRDQGFNESCQTIVHNEHEHRVARANGWRDSAAEAMEHVREIEGVIAAAAAAERLYRDRNMSDKAKAEAQAADDATPNMLAEIPEAKLDKRTKAYKDSLRTS